jgi:hypothetical protein
MKPSILRYTRRGPQPKISWEDALILILTFYHLGLKFEVASAAFDISTTAMKEVIVRIRPILHRTLSERWLEQKKRPVPLPTTSYPYIGLLVDSMSVEVFRPKGCFEEVKVYWDAKHCMCPQEFDFLQLNRTMLSSFKKLVLALFTITKCTKEDIISTKNIFSKQQMREMRFQMILILVGQFLWTRNMLVQNLTHQEKDESQSQRTQQQLENRNEMKNSHKFECGSNVSLVVCSNYSSS